MVDFGRFSPIGTAALYVHSDEDLSKFIERLNAKPAERPSPFGFRVVVSKWMREGKVFMHNGRPMDDGFDCQYFDISEDE